MRRYRGVVFDIQADGPILVKDGSKLVPCKRGDGVLTARLDVGVPVFYRLEPGERIGIITYREPHGQDPDPVDGSALRAQLIAAGVLRPAKESDP